MSAYLQRRGWDNEIKKTILRIMNLDQMSLKINNEIGIL